jgi:hypothetical protein
MHDLASAQPERAKAMADTWQKWAKASNVLPLQDPDRKRATKPAAE